MLRFALALLVLLAFRPDVAQSARSARHASDPGIGARDGGPALSLHATDSVQVVPGPGYARSAFARFFVGSGHRALWLTPIKVPIADLSVIGGGVTPMRVGGGMTTRTLHVRGNDGKRYVLRSVNKYPGQGLDEELRGTIYESALQDQVSSFHPTAALVLPGLLEAVDVLHVTPKLYVLPDDARLGEFREMFAGELVLVEERPNEGPDDTPGFAGSRKIVDTEGLFDRLEKEPANRLDSRAYLRARLIDLLVGDRDKSVNNWWWARFDAGGAGGERYLWQPLPRDRDQAFIQLEGLAIGALRMYEPRMARFSEDVPNVVGLTRSAWDMDRPFLVEIDKAEWDSIVADVQSRLSDTVIDSAVRRMPGEHVAVYGDEMAERLRTRRDRLAETADRFYRIVARYADIFASDADENATVDYVDEDRAVVTLRARTKDGSSSPYFSRTFMRQETREIRLYLRGGSDHVVVTGDRPNITLRVSGGGGKDHLTDSTRSPGKSVVFYDSGDRTSVDVGSNVRHSGQEARIPRSWGETGPNSPDWGTTWAPRFAFPYTSDLGFLVYAGAQRTRFGFLKDPYKNQLRFGAGYAPRENKIIAHLAYEIQNFVGRVDGLLRGGYSGIEVLHFFGFGNDTEKTEGSEFYKLRRGLILLETVASLQAARDLEIDADVRFEVSRTDTTPDRPNFIAQYQPYGWGTLSQVSAGAAVRYDTRDDKLSATKGVFVEARGRFYPGALDLSSGAFGKLEGGAATYVSFTKSARQTVAIKIGGEKVWGAYPYYGAAFLGGPHRLRGYSRERFAGDGSAYGSAELRLEVGQFGWLVPWHLGVFGFGDAGRVFVDGKSPGGWHAAAGFGLWGAPLYRRFTGSLTVAFSEEGTTVYLGAGFGI